MFSIDDLSLVAKTTRSELAQQVLYSLYLEEPHLYRITDLGQSLSRNENLTIDVWSSMYKESESSIIKANLLANAPSATQADLIHSEGVDSAVSYALEFGAKNLTIESLSRLVESKRFTVAKALALLSSNKAPKELLPKLWQITKSNSTSIMGALDMMVGGYNALTTSEIAETILNHTFRDTSTILVTRLLDYKPELANYLAADGLKFNFYSDVAQSRHITQELSDHIFNKVLDNDWYKKHRAQAINPLRAGTILWNLVKNPATSVKKRLEIISHIKAKLPEQIAMRQVNTYLAYFNGSIPYLGKSWGGYVDGDPSTHGTISNEVAAAATYVDIHCYPTLIPKMVKLGYLSRSDFEYDLDHDKEYSITKSDILNVISPALDTCGVDSWKIFLELLPDFQGNIEDLLSLCASLSIR